MNDITRKTITALVKSAYLRGLQLDKHDPNELEAEIKFAINIMSSILLQTTLQNKEQN